MLKIFIFLHLCTFKTPILLTNKIFKDKITIKYNVILMRLHPIYNIVKS